MDTDHARNLRESAQWLLRTKRPLLATFATEISSSLREGIVYVRIGFDGPGLPDKLHCEWAIPVAQVEAGDRALVDLNLRALLRNCEETVAKALRR